MDRADLDPDSAVRLATARERIYVTEAQAEEAVRIYEQVLRLGLSTKPIEEILFEKGMITASQAAQLTQLTAATAPAGVGAARERVAKAEAALAAEPEAESAKARELPATKDIGREQASTVALTVMRVRDALARSSETSGATRGDAPLETLAARAGALPVKEIAGFRLVERVGAGSNGTVYKAIQISMSRPVALKILSKRLATNARFVERFLREARVAAKLNHPNIIGGIDVGEDNGLYYFAMEFADGRTVREMLERGGALDERQSLIIVLQIARGLDQAYRHGLIHRDIKPDNIIITKNQVAKLLDLGLAREAGETNEEAGKTFGTPNYISPEQARGDAVIDTRSDIYSLGATLYHMLTGRTPFQGNPAIVMAKHISEPAVDPQTIVPGISAASVALVKTMMAKTAAERHQSPQELIDHLEGALAKLDPAKAAAPKPAGAVRRRRRRL